MNPDTRMAWTLGSALILWSPAAISMATGGVEIMEGGLMFLAALAFAWIGSGIVSMIVENYRRSNHQLDQAKQQIELLEQRAVQRAERRRAADKPRSDDNA